MRHAHFWRAGRSNPVPSNIVCFDSETLPSPYGGDAPAELHRLRLGWACGFRLEKGRRTREEWCNYYTADAFWEFLERRLDRSRPLWVFAHNLPFDLGTVEGWRRLTSDRFEWDRVILSPSITYLAGMVNGRKIVFCDSCNYYHCPLATIGAAVGCVKRSMPPFAAPDEQWSDYCYNDVEVLARGMVSLINFVRSHRCGGWGPTVASLAFKSYLRSFLKEKVLVHDEESVLSLERSSYYGGMVSVGFVGRVPTDITHECDISSHYPSCCLCPLPTRLVGHSLNPAPAATLSALRTHWCCADVTLTTYHPNYPVRWSGAVYYPVGTVRTCLADQELRHAVESGTVKLVHQLAWYTQAPLFEGYMEYWYRLKTEYEKEGNTAYRNICKLLMNSLYGKCGQMTPRWVPWGPAAIRMVERSQGVPPGSLEWIERMDMDLSRSEETMSVEGLPEPLRLRDYFGEVEVMVGEHESRDSCPAIAAGVTSIGRVRLRLVQSTAGEREWYYSDTDSVWCSDTGVSNLRTAGMVSEGQMGGLEIKQTVQGFTVHGPKDYEYLGGKKLKGIRPSAEQLAPDRYRQLHFPSALSQMRDGLDEGVLVRMVEKRLSRENRRVRVTETGWTEPLRAGEDFPPKCP